MKTQEELFGGLKLNGILMLILNFLFLFLVVFLFVRLVSNPPESAVATSVMGIGIFLLFLCLHSLRGYKFPYHRRPSRISFRRRE